MAAGTIIAGRGIDSFTLTRRQLAELVAVARGVSGLSVVVGMYDPDPEGDPDENIFARVVVGFVAATAKSERANGETADPLPLDLAMLDAALERARDLDASALARLARVLPTSPQGYTPAQRAASLTAVQRPLWEGVAYDSTDFATTAPRLFLVANGGRAVAIVARGTTEKLPVDEDGFTPEGLQNEGWVFHRGNSERPENGVRGEEVLRVSCEGLAALPFPNDALHGQLYLLVQR